MKNPNTLRQCYKRNLQWLYFLHLKLTAKLFIWEYITSIEFFPLNGKIMDNSLGQIAPIISSIILLEWRQDIAKGAITWNACTFWIRFSKHMFRHLFYYIFVTFTKITICCIWSFYYILINQRGIFVLLNISFIHSRSHIDFYFFGIKCSLISLSHIIEIVLIRAFFLVI